MGRVVLSESQTSGGKQVALEASGDPLSDPQSALATLSPHLALYSSTLISHYRRAYSIPGTPQGSWLQR